MNNKLIDSLPSEEIAELIGENIEVVVDQVIENGVLKDIPIIGSILKLYKTGASIREYYFLQKMLKFLQEASKIPKEIRMKFWEELNENPKVKNNLGEKIILALDKIDDDRKSIWISIGFRELMVGKISTVQFYDLVYSIERFKAHYEIEYFDYAKYFILPLTKHVIDHFYNTGTLEMISRNTRRNSNSSIAFRVAETGKLLLAIMFESNLEVLKFRGANYLIGQLKVSESRIYKEDKVFELREFDKSEVLKHVLRIDDDIFYGIRYNSFQLEFDKDKFQIRRITKNSYKLFKKSTEQA